ncbi:DUF2282 domain-containing protein [Methylomonas methanica]|uniref:Uncharacterized protein n=1 Tax=Methylomonas methanica (strain DSM 25384 / MC09) TaxID=857087 RepID=F9ZYT5_METMM|nr:DUF2282 domain-containing protein [Methylomonas methanica]AEF98631.1 Protein of unknown function DUF2282, transmembrane [Methylomonas methanica MC09]
MKNANTFIAAGLAAVIGAGSQAVSYADEMPAVEKCYGIAKAGKNDCKTQSNICAGHAFADKQADTFVALPAGTCQRIVGGSLTAPADN